MEILVVMTISMILMVLVMAPVLRSFEMTRRAQAMVDAQDSARAAMEQISREIGEAMDVLDYTADPIELPVWDPNASGGTGAVYWLPLPYAKIDLILPKLIAHCNAANHPADQPRDFERGDEALPMCPSGDNSTDVDIRPKLPIEQGNTVVRYFLGLKYNDPGASTSRPRIPAGSRPMAMRSPRTKATRSCFIESNSTRRIRPYSTVTRPKPPSSCWTSCAIPSSSIRLRKLTTGQELWKHWARKARALGLRTTRTW